ncbi:putative methyltransferase-domain-containing protein [Collybia nuda]|uniref:Protein N-terminal and lysine N-methyltransferase EFM7 n=1 Tax=Collybia nuda TaxID=64659 RepID=A0A9P6CHQ3_9AGAR|nr:putative methyltransferase-domain-containing protein [Collybia nuda]
MSDNNDDIDLALDDIFAEPPRPSTPKPTFAVYTRQNSKLNGWSQIKIRLVGTHPLWGNYLWNAARAFASYLDENPELYQNRSVLELGAGGGLPSIVAAKNGAQQVVITDYPDDELVENMSHNVEANIPIQERSHISVQGYVWGRPVDSLLSIVKNATPGFDLIILSDLIFNHSQHDALLTTCESAISLKLNKQPPPSVLVFYTHHRPHLAHRDMLFFTKARERGWICEEILTEIFPPMFPKDSGEEIVRSTVHGWRLLRIS